MLHLDLMILVAFFLTRPPSRRLSPYESMRKNLQVEFKKVLNRLADKAGRVSA